MYLCALRVRNFRGKELGIVKRSFSSNNCIFLLKRMSLNKFLTNKFQKEIKIEVMLMRFSSFLWIINIVKIIIILLNISGNI